MNIKRKDVPAWYELGTSEDCTQLIIKIHEKAMAFSLKGRITRKSPIVQGFQEQFRIPAFIEPTKENWGFGERMVLQKSEDGWSSYTCQLPVILKGPEATKTRIEEALSLSATLCVLFLGLMLLEEETDCNLPQLITIDNLCVDIGMHGGSFSVGLSPALCSWIHQKPNNYQPEEMVSAMITANEYMWPDTDSNIIHKYSFRAECRQPKWIHLTCPGDACGLDPEFAAEESLERGYRLLPHNIDSSLQQFTLLIGIATLYQLARKQGF